MIPHSDNVTILLRSRESAERTVREIVDLQIQREKAIAARDAAIEKAISSHVTKIDEMTERIDRDFALLETWAIDNREEFGKGKSIALAGHRLGWRTGNPKVEGRGKLTLKGILAELVKTGGELKEAFVREKHELNKEAILELHRVSEGRSAGLTGLDEEERKKAQENARITLRGIGIEVTQVESFFLEPDREGQPDIRLTGESKEAA